MQQVPASEFRIRPLRAKHALPLSAEFRDEHGYSWEGGRRCDGEVVLTIGTHVVARIGHSYTSDHADGNDPEAESEEYAEVAKAVEGWFDRVNETVRECDSLLDRVIELERGR